MRDWTKRPTTEVIVVINARVLMVWAQKVEAKKGVNKKCFSGNGYSISQLIKFQLLDKEKIMFILRLLRMFAHK